ncbi:hypothetical protein IF1G_05659 [Cordyceps javanica]|uniref:Uncharacterized protein n=1 Tax=Cordyceps javanica TaxID=43265 RepID=A0A545V292_9HYPO|nr:hypothetical protein IF1G_05659 [Cordyceps javanica]
MIWIEGNLPEEEGSRRTKHTPVTSRMDTGTEDLSNFGKIPSVGYLSAKLGVSRTFVGYLTSFLHYLAQADIFANSRGRYRKNFTALGWRTGVAACIVSCWKRSCGPLANRGVSLRRTRSCFARSSWLSAANAGTGAGQTLRFGERPGVQSWGRHGAAARSAPDQAGRRESRQAQSL